MLTTPTKRAEISTKCGRRLLPNMDNFYKHGQLLPKNFQHQSFVWTALLHSDHTAVFLAFGVLGDSSFCLWHKMSHLVPFNTHVHLCPSLARWPWNSKGVGLGGCFCGIEPTLHCRFTAQHYLHMFLRTTVLPNISLSFELLCCIQITLLSFWPLVCLVTARSAYGTDVTPGFNTHTGASLPTSPVWDVCSRGVPKFQSEHMVQGCAVCVVRVSRSAMQGLARSLSHSIFETPGLCRSGVAFGAVFARVVGCHRGHLLRDPVLSLFGCGLPVRAPSIFLLWRFLLILGVTLPWSRCFLGLVIGFPHPSSSRPGVGWHPAALTGLGVALARAFGLRLCRGCSRDFLHLLRGLSIHAFCEALCALRKCVHCAFLVTASMTPTSKLG